MSDRGSMDCDLFDRHADELALGQIDEPLRSRLLAHAVDCAHCHALLDGLGLVTDRLLLAAPRLEPPAGFENRVLARLQPTQPADRPTAKRWWVAGAVAAVMVLAAGALLTSRLVGHEVADAVAIVAADGSEIGSVELVAEPVPHVVVAIASPRPGPGIRTCELRGRDGAWEDVGWWDAADIASGVWAVGIDARLLDATEMRITAGGEVIATATFD